MTVDTPADESPSPEETAIELLAAPMLDEGKAGVVPMATEDTADDDTVDQEDVEEATTLGEPSTEELALAATLVSGAELVAI